MTLATGDLNFPIFFPFLKKKRHSQEYTDGRLFLFVFQNSTQTDWDHLTFLCLFLFILVMTTAEEKLSIIITFVRTRLSSSGQYRGRMFFNAHFSLFKIDDGKVTLE